ncbi:MAG: PilZ domain-containing protein [Proteobacteria bacterium]|nr:PilZ domain-containing protein [Pseudomonadota bacterium]
MSRRYPRIRAELTATVRLEGSNSMLVCRTRNISHRGCFLDTAQLIAPGTGVFIAILDAARGAAMEVEGRVVRCLPAGADGYGRGIGVRFEHPPQEWTELISRHQKTSLAVQPLSKRLRVLVVGDRARQRGAMALYVTSGWDVRFATDLASAEDALRCVELSAVIAEVELSAVGNETDSSAQHWKDVLDIAREIQPEARRIVRSALDGRSAPAARISGLFHRIVDRDAGLDALLDALTADLGPSPE